MAKWGMDVKAAPGLRGTPPDAAVSEQRPGAGKISAHNHMEWL